MEIEEETLRYIVEQAEMLTERLHRGASEGRLQVARRSGPDHTKRAVAGVNKWCATVADGDSELHSCIRIADVRE